MTSSKATLDYTTIFPIPLFKTQLDVPDSEIDFWLNQSVVQKSRSVSVRNGWQSPKYKMRSPATKFLESSPLHFKVTSWWANVLQPGGFNVYHTHPGVDFAAVWYLTDATGLVLNNPHQHYFYNHFQHFRDLNTGHLMTMHLTAQRGDIYIFPAHLSHAVEETNQLRISIAFNLSCQPDNS